jgi:transketolase
MSESAREAIGKTLVQLAWENRDIVVLDADLGSSSRVTYFAETFPERFFQMGIAEQNMMGVAAGMALMGKIPFVSTFGVFASRRACDQVAISIAHAGANVKICGLYSGLVSGNNGATHQSMEDVAIMRGIPGMTVIDPGDDVEAAQAVRAIVKYKGPVYLRVTRDDWGRISPDGYQFEIGKAVQIRTGQDVTLIGSGMMTSQCLEAAKILSSSGIDALVLHVATIKPIDIDAIVHAARNTGAIVTAENHNILGGLGGAVAEILCEHAPTPLVRIGVRDCYGECGANLDLLEKYGMSPRHIAEAAREAISKREQNHAVATC